MKLLLLASDPGTLMELSRYGDRHRWEVVVVNSVAELEMAENLLIPDLILMEAPNLYTELGNRVRQLRDRWQAPALLSVKQDELHNYSRYLVEEFDDFVSLPFTFDELLLRIRLLVRDILNAADHLQIGPLVLNKKTHSVSVDGRELPLTPKQYDLLYLLMQQQSDVLPNETIYDAIWPDSKRVAASDVQQFVYQLRRRLRSLAGDRVQIENLRGLGYRVVSSTPTPVE